MFARPLRNSMLNTKSIFYRNFTGTIDPLFYLGSEFDDILEGNMVYADKTLLLKSLLKEKCMLVTRPRRWGKSLNLSMIESFFQPQVSEDGIISRDEEKKENFRKFEINKEILPYNPITKKTQETKFIDLQGSLPVIKLIFTDAKPKSERHLEIYLANVLQNTIQTHMYLLKSPKVDPDDKNRLQNYFKNDKFDCLDDIMIINTLATLIRSLKAHYGTKVILLVDEYDKFLISLAEQNSKFYEYGLHLYSEMFLCLKGFIQKNVQFSLFTGVSRLAQTNCLSGLNCFTHDSVQKSLISEFYGLTETEVDKLIEQTQSMMTEKFDIVKVKKQIEKWYNGYNIQGKTIYNPFSIINSLKCLMENDPEPYSKFWSNSGSTELLCSSIQHLPTTKFIENLEQNNLIAFTPINHAFNKISDGDVEHKDILTKTIFQNSDSFLTFMMDAGYLTMVADNKYRLPNKEIIEIFHKEIALKWLKIKMPYLANASYVDNEIEDIKMFCSSFQVKILDKIIIDDNNTPEYVFKSLLYFSSYNSINRLEKYSVLLERSTEQKKRIDIALLPNEESDTLFIIEYKKDYNLSNTVQIKNGMLQIMELYASEAIKISNEYKHIKKIILRAVAFVIVEGKWKIFAEEFQFNEEGLKSAIDSFNKGAIDKKDFISELSKYAIKRVSS